MSCDFFFKKKHPVLQLLHWDPLSLSAVRQQDPVEARRCGVGWYKSVD